jgi:hypothetical protein
LLFNLLDSGVCRRAEAATLDDAHLAQPLVVSYMTELDRGRADLAQDFDLAAPDPQNAVARIALPKLENHGPSAVMTVSFPIGALILINNCFTIIIN